MKSDPEEGAELGVTGRAGAAQRAAAEWTHGGRRHDRAALQHSQRYLSHPQQEAHQQKRTRRPFSLTETCFYWLHTEKATIKTPQKKLQGQFLNIQGWRVHGFDRRREEVFLSTGDSKHRGASWCRFTSHFKGSSVAQGPVRPFHHHH